MQPADFLRIISVTDAGAAVVSNSTPPAITVSVNKLVEICRGLHANAETYFDQLSCVTGIDNGVEAKTMEVIYHLYSIPYNFSVALKVVLPREQPVVPTLSSVWKSANWLERETFDMYGIIFEGHPDLRRILMPADWEGYPLRKDYSEQEKYREIQVKY
ncbi:MAG TPA: NADH-quinone oxidoreductase subunit C [Cyclobacteriaceae bacterium]|nr:NADH-quinone oxidoreductase subunit C [Cyclobacteriaceae bacterium]